MKTLADVFEHTLQDVYYAENAIVKALPKVIEAVEQRRSQNGPQRPSGRDQGPDQNFASRFQVDWQKGLRREVRCNGRLD
jgi:Domain of unknown function (DUF892)